MVEAYIDRWSSGNVVETVPISVDKAALTTALASLDGRRSTEMSFRSDGKALLVGGQGGQYFVQYLLPEDLGAWILVGSPDASGETELTMGRQSASYPTRQIVGIDRALQAAMSFIRNGGDRDRRLVWDRHF